MVAWEEGAAGFGMRLFMPIETPALSLSLVDFAKERCGTLKARSATSGSAWLPENQRCCILEADLLVILHFQLRERYHPLKRYLHG